MRARKLANVLCAWIYFLIGGVYAAYQVLIPRVIASLGGSPQAISLLVASLFLGSVLTTLISGEISERFGKRITLIISCAALAAGCLMVCAAKNIWVAIAGIMISGFGIGGNEGATLSILEDANPDNSDQVLCYVMALYGLGGFLVPLLTERWFPQDSYRPVLMIFSALYTASSVWALLAGKVDTVCVFRPEKQKGMAVSILWTNKTLLLSVLALAVYCGLESGLTYYAVDVFGRFGSSAAGSYAVSAYWLAVMVGSFTGGLVKNMLQCLSLLLLAGGTGVALVLLIPSIPLKIGLMCLVGLLLGPAYGLISYLGGHSAPENSGMAYAAMAFGASLGGAAFQPVAAAVLGAFPVTATYLLVIAFCVLDAYLVHVVRKREG